MKRIFGIISCIIYISSGINSQTAPVILDSMFTKIDSIKTIQFVLHSKERMGELYLDGKSDVKVRISPFNIQYRQRYPNEGLEIFFDEEKDEEKVRVNTNTFPYIPLNLNPYNMLMRKDRHHTIFEMEVMNYMAEATKKILDKPIDQIEVQMLGLYKINGIECYKIKLHNGTFSYVNYTVMHGETLYDIGVKLKVCDYMIVEINEDIDNFSDISPGQIIKVPSEYAYEIEMDINKLTYLPIQIKLYDDKGLFEKYYFEDLVVNENL